ncbi:geminin coiled-coil domain-containing protein 1 [Heptranchias perlo]|uniref:geminin coiled-coil domain-containing protein 1 n=1 Tax=Heptranchias perlo TaxID=212740 RepID=UPI00355A7874
MNENVVMKRSGRAFEHIYTATGNIDCVVGGGSVDLFGRISSRARRELRSQTGLQSTILSCQDQYFVGDQGYEYSSSVSTSASVDISMETWYSQWPGGILDNSRSSQQEAQPQDYFSDFDTTAQDEFRWTGHLSSQLHKNKQLQDTLEQKEEELARLHEENTKLREYLNSTYVKSLEDKARKLLTQNGQKNRGIFKCKKRLFQKQEEAGIYYTDQPTSENLPKRGRGNSSCKNGSSFYTAQEDDGAPCVETWVLKTLGLKDANTIDDSSSANYSAVTPETSVDYSSDQLKATDYSTDRAMPPDYGQHPAAPMGFLTSSCRLDSACSDQLSPGPHYPPPSRPSHALCPSAGSPFYKAAPKKTDVAFSTSLNPHRNVKTHTFCQGQAFVQRDGEGGWRFTWVPSQTD